MVVARAPHLPYPTTKPPGRRHWHCGEPFALASLFICLPENSQPAERLQHWKQASATSDIMAYLDDCTLNSRMKAVVMASAGYMGEGVKRNWQFVDYKSILSGAWDAPPLQTELWDETIEREDGQPPPQANSRFSVSTRPMCAEILP